MKTHRVLSVSVSICLLAALLFAALLLFPHRGAHADPLAVQQRFVQQTGNIFAEFTPSPLGIVRVYSVAGFCGADSTSGGQIVIHTTTPLPNQAEIAKFWMTGPTDIGNNITSYYWVTPLVTTAGTNLEITLVGCNGSLANTLIVQSSVN